METQQLTQSQQEALSALQGHRNVFLTGEAGSGKSFVVQRYREALDDKAFPILASTGAAAVLIGGRTFHSFLGLGIMEGGLLKTIERALGNRRIVRRLQKVAGFVIDEISMIPGQTLMAAEIICRRARGRDEPWGGLRVVAVGDFAQLPPVDRGYSGLRDWAFTSDVWTDSQFLPVVLNQNLRIKNQEFLKILNFVRRGQVNSDVQEFLESKVDKVGDEFNGTRLFPRRNATDSFNLSELNKIKGQEQVFPTTYAGNERALKQLKKFSPLPEEVRLKEGALVMLRCNDPKGRWVNGSTGHVVKISPMQLSIELLDGNTIKVEPQSFSLLDGEGEPVAAVTNFPITLAYATTIHKSQGMTLDQVHIDLRNLWEPGQAYVALSRVKDPRGLRLVDWQISSFKADPVVEAFYAHLKDEWKPRAGQMSLFAEI